MNLGETIIQVGRVFLLPLPEGLLQMGQYIVTHLSAPHKD